MKLSSSLILSLTFVMLLGCTKRQDQLNKPSVTTSDSIKKTINQGADSVTIEIKGLDFKRDLILDDLLKLKSEAELIKRYGRENVIRDTLVYPGGLKALCSRLFKGTEGDVEIEWYNADKFENAIHVRISARGNDYSSRWKTMSGITLGSTSEELIKINGGDFNTFGFDQPLFGQVSTWKGGKLDNKYLDIYLRGDKTRVTDEEYKKLIGGPEISSSDPVVKKFVPRVYRLSFRDLP